MLLNLVRMKYRDTSVFLEVNAFTSQYALTNSVSASGDISGNIRRSISILGGSSYEEKPTVSYTPLQGQKFITRMLSRVKPETLTLLHGSGWSVERLFLTLVERVNSVKNAPTASGPTPEFVPEYKDFQRFAKVLRRLQRDNAYVKVNYRGYWYYIDDNDLNSKSTFNLLMQLYNLQSGDNKGNGPILTLPIGG